LITPEAKPIVKPPSVAVQSRSIPPTTTPTSTTIVSRRAKSGETNGVCTVSSTATVAASRPERSAAKPITRFARTPSSCAVRKSLAAARVWRPMVVRVSRSATSASARAATTTATMVILRTSTPPTDTDRFSGATDPAISPIVLSRRSMISATAWSMKAIANVVTSMTAGDWPRRGRKIARSIASESATTTAKQATMLAATGQPEVNASV